LNQANNQTTIGIALPGLSRDLPFGYPVYNFSISVTDQGGLGVSSYAPVSITVIDSNNNAPIPTVISSKRNFFIHLFFKFRIHHGI
jgi:hypothetical protein